MELTMTNELDNNFIPLAFGPYPFVNLSAAQQNKNKNKPAGTRLLSSLSAAQQEKATPASPVHQLAGGGIGPSVGANWPPSRRREEARALKNLERRVGPLKVNLRSSFNRVPLLDKQDDLDLLADTKEKSPDRENSEVKKCWPLLRKIISNRPLVISNNNESNTEWQTSDIISECLCWHNVYRQRHGVQPLDLCPTLCSYAQEWANTLAHTNTFKYRNNVRDVGQNIYCRLNVKEPAEVTGQEVSTYWYSACRRYDYLKEPDVLHANVNAGHFTQMIWAGTCDVGIGIARSRSGKVMVVANYRPPGNISGQFQENVLPPLLEVSSDVSSEYS